MKYRINQILLCFLLLVSSFISREQSWKISGEMKYPVSGSVAVTKDSLIYIIGGYSDSLQSNVKWIQKFDPSSNHSEIVANMLESRYGFFAGVYNEKLYIYGGINEVNENAFVLEEWDFISANTTISNSNELFDRVFPTGGIYNDNLLMIGGYAASRGSFASLPYISEYNFQTFQVTSVDDTSFISNQLPIQQMSSLVENKLFVFGGAFNGVLQSIDLIDMDNFNSVRMMEKLISPRAGGIAVYSCYSDKIFLIGGYNESLPATNSTEIIYDYDIALKVMQGPALNYPRRNLAAVVLKDKIFVLGGENANGSVINMIEELQTEPVSVIEDQEVINDFQLHQNYPNPFNPSTFISFSVTKSVYLQLDIFNSIGEKVYTLYNGFAQPGIHTLTWNGKDFSGNVVSSGIYFYRLSNKFNFLTKKMLLLK